MRILITICARGGSKGIPGKNIRPLNGIPLIAYTLKNAFDFSNRYSAEIELSTDDIEIKSIAKKFGLNTEYVRPDFLATDQAGKLDTIYDLIKYKEHKLNYKFDYILDLDVTSPLRNIEDLEKAFDMILNDSNAANIFSVNTAHRNPYFNMVEKKENGYFGLIKKGNFLTRQSAPIVYDLNASFYFYKRDFFESQDRSVINNNSLIYVMPHICFDLDHNHDFDFMEYLIISNKLGFEL